MTGPAWQDLLGDLEAVSPSAEPDNTVKKISCTYPVYVGVSTRIDPDPLGDVNCIVRLMRHNGDGSRTPIKSALVPNRPGMKVQLGWGPPSNVGPDSPWFMHVWNTHYFVEVDGRRVIEVPEHETWEPLPPVKVRLGRRVRNAARRNLRRIGDPIAGWWFGYRHVDDFYREDW